MVRMASNDKLFSKGQLSDYLDIRLEKLRQEVISIPLHSFHHVDVEECKCPSYPMFR